MRVTVTVVLDLPEESHPERLPNRLYPTREQSLGVLALFDVPLDKGEREVPTAPV